MIELTALRWVPEFAQGHVRDLRARWALEEAGLAYRERLVGREDLGGAEYRALQPFGQVPSLIDDGLVLFESGAIVLHIAAKSDALMPRDPAERARVTSWMFAAVNSVEPPLQMIAELDFFSRDAAANAAVRATRVDRARARLGALAEALGDREYLCTRFTAADILMATVLRIARHTELVADQPVLAAYQARCERRPAFAKALDDQLAAFARHAPAAA